VGDDAKPQHVSQLITAAAVLQFKRIVILAFAWKLLRHLEQLNTTLQQLQPAQQQQWKTGSVIPAIILG